MQYMQEILYIVVGLPPPFSLAPTQLTSSHQGISTHTIWLATTPPSTSCLTQTKLIKLGRVGFPTRLLDLRRSNPFGSNTDESAGGNLGTLGEEGVPEAWYVVRSFRLFAAV
jgi:hypothetical protein